VANTGPLGEKRGLGFGILMFVVTLGIYSLYWTYKTFEEMKRHTGDGVGGGVGLLIGVLISVVNFFLVPSEVGRMYRGDGRTAPVSGWTGLWYFLPLIGLFVWWFKVQGALNDYWDAKVLAPTVATAT
jgi:hypothetical protein